MEEVVTRNSVSSTSVSHTGHYITVCVLTGKARELCDSLGRPVRYVFNGGTLGLPDRGKRAPGRSGLPPPAGQVLPGRGRRSGNPHRGPALPPRATPRLGVP